MGTTYIKGGSGFNTATNKGWGDIGNNIQDNIEYNVLDPTTNTGQ